VKKREADVDLKRACEFTKQPKGDRKFQYQYGLSLSVLDRSKPRWFKGGNPLWANNKMSPLLAWVFSLFLALRESPFDNHRLWYLRIIFFCEWLIDWQEICTFYDLGSKLSLFFYSIEATGMKASINDSTSRPQYTR